MLRDTVLELLGLLEHLGVKMLNMLKWLRLYIDEHVGRKSVLGHDRNTGEKTFSHRHEWSLPENRLTGSLQSVHFLRTPTASHRTGSPAVLPGDQRKRGLPGDSRPGQPVTLAGHGPIDVGVLQAGGHVRLKSDSLRAAFDQGGYMGGTGICPLSNRGGVDTGGRP